MKRTRLILRICSCVCLAIVAMVVAVAVSYSEPKHRHTLTDAKTYFVYDDHIEYTRGCTDGCTVKFDTGAKFNDLFLMTTEQDKIVLEDDIVLNSEIYLKSYITLEDTLEFNINLDLNNHTISTDIADSENDSMFMFNANRGNVNLNVSNGKLLSETTSYIFRFKNTKRSGQNIKINLDNVECEVSGIEATPLFAHDCVNIEFNANNSKFISNTVSSNNGDYGVGAFINSDSEFNFDNCYFEGGDAVYVKDGVVNLKGCKLVNSGLAHHSAQGVETLFSAVGACLTVDSHSDGSSYTKFIVTIDGCEMESQSSVKMIYALQTANDAGVEVGLDPNSIVNVLSCKFNNDPNYEGVPSFEDSKDIIKYPNNEAPQNYGTETWICGNWSESINN